MSPLHPAACSARVHTLTESNVSSLQEGMARILDWSLAVLPEGREAYRAAEKYVARPHYGGNRQKICSTSMGRSF